MVILVLIGAVAIAGGKAYSHHKKSKARKALAREQAAQAQAQAQTQTEPDFTDETALNREELYEDEDGNVSPPPYQKDLARGQGTVVVSSVRDVGEGVGEHPPKYEEGPRPSIPRRSSTSKEEL